MPPLDDARSIVIARLNDEFRTELLINTPLNCQLVLSRYVGMLATDQIDTLLDLVRKFDVFNEENDPWGEHDFGSVTMDGTQYFWKIDYFDLAKEYLSIDATRPDITVRVLTVMLAEEY